MFDSTPAFFGVLVVEELLAVLVTKKCCRKALAPSNPTDFESGRFS
jgi:hypothetical protein